MADMIDIDKYVKARDEAFEADDLDFARQMLPAGTDPSVVELTFHKARYEAINVSDVKRLASQRFLANRGSTRLTGERIRLGDPLPV